MEATYSLNRKHEMLAKAFSITPLIRQVNTTNGKSMCFTISPLTVVERRRIEGSGSLMKRSSVCIMESKNDVWHWYYLILVRASFSDSSVQNLAEIVHFAMKAWNLAQSNFGVYENLQYRMHFQIDLASQPFLLATNQQKFQISIYSCQV